MAPLVTLGAVTAPHTPFPRKDGQDFGLEPGFANLPSSTSANRITQPQTNGERIGTELGGVSFAYTFIYLKVRSFISTGPPARSWAHRPDQVLALHAAPGARGGDRNGSGAATRSGKKLEEEDADEAPKRAVPPLGPRG